jgi:uncharacterized lipoprotein YajG
MYIRYCCLTLCGLLLVACANRPAQYTVDPEIQLTNTSISPGKTFTIEVIAPPAISGTSNDRIELSPDSQFDKTVKANLIKALGKQGFRFSANPHFSDVTITLDFSQLTVQINKQLMRDTLEVDGRLSIQLARKQTRLNKSFQRKQTLTVALSSDYAEVTGLVNQVVSNLLQTALTDSDVVAFINQMQ